MVIYMSVLLIFALAEEFNLESPETALDVLHDCADYSDHCGNDNLQALCGGTCGQDGLGLRSRKLEAHGGYRYTLKADFVSDCPGHVSADAPDLCLNSNHGYATLEEAKEACDGMEDCGAVADYKPTQNFFLRRATDPKHAESGSYLHVKVKAADNFYAIGHMANSLEVVRWFKNHGYNGLEMDIQYDEEGNPTRAHHGWPTGCSCPWVFLFGDTVCKFHRDLQEPDAPFVDILRWIGGDWRELPLLMIDAKTGSDEELWETAGRAMVHFLEEHLLRLGFKGIVLIDSTKQAYLRSASSTAALSDYQDQFYFSYYDEAKGPIWANFHFMASLATPRNIIFHAGVTACSPSLFNHEIAQLRWMKEQELISNVLTWTVDTEKNWSSLYISGARMIITNMGTLPEWARSNNIKLATVGDGSILPRRHAVLDEHDDDPNDHFDAVLDEHDPKETTMHTTIRGPPMQEE